MSQFLAARSGSAPSRLRPRRGFTLLEMMTVVAIIGILGALSAMGIQAFVASGSLKYAVSSLQGNLSSARERAQVTTRTQIVVVSANNTSPRRYGFYVYEDARTPPNIFSVADLTAVLANLTPPTINVTGLAAAGYSLRAVNSDQLQKSPFLMASNAWAGATLPYPWDALGVSNVLATTNGCTFCDATTKVGAVAFLANGRAIFSNGATAGMVVLTGGTGSAPGQVTGVGVNRLGFVQAVNR